MPEGRAEGVARTRRRTEGVRDAGGASGQVDGGGEVRGRRRRLHPDAIRAVTGLAPAIDLAKRFCWVTNTIRTPPQLRYHLGAPIG